jgi:hypothetical protein
MSRSRTNPITVWRSITFLTILLITVFQSILLSNPAAFAQESTDVSESAELVISDQKIKFTHYVGLGYGSPLYPIHDTTFDFTIINITESPFSNLTILRSALVIKEVPKFSLAPSYIGAGNVTVALEREELGIDEQFSINSNENVRLSYIIPSSTLLQLKDNEGTYEGKIQIIGPNIKTMTIPVEVSFQDNPWIYSGFVVAGIGASIGVGLLYLRYEKRDEIKTKTEDDIGILSHINGHIRSMNAMRTAIENNAWDRICQQYNDKKAAVVKYRDRIELDESAEAVMWFEANDNLMHEKLALEPNLFYKGNEPLQEIYKPEMNDPDYLLLSKKIVKDRIKQQQIEDRQDWRKIVYGSAVAIVGSYATIFTTANLVGNTAANVFIAASIGFALYRSQDLLKLLPWTKNDTAKAVS